MTRAAFWPPKPKLVDTAVRTREFARRVRHIVEVALWIGMRLVDRGRNHPGVEGEGQSHGFHGSRSPDQVADHRFDGGQRKDLRPSPKTALTARVSI